MIKKLLPRHDDIRRGHAIAGNSVSSGNNVSSSDIIKLRTTSEW